MMAIADAGLATRSSPRVDTVRWTLPSGSDVDCRDNFFLGYWQPSGSLRVLFDAPESLGVTTLAGPTWMLASATSRLHRPARPLIHQTMDGAVAFRGYVLEPPLHSYGESQAIVDYWIAHNQRQHNGLFAVAVIGAQQPRLQLRTDYLGMTPLYWRRLGPGIAFATNPRYLACHGDNPDLVAWLEVMRTSFISSDRSLSKEIHRLPAGHLLCADTVSLAVRPWFEFDSLPAGQRRVGPSANAEVEQTFRESMRRCERLAGGRTILPLSSGHDSRRILAAFLADSVEFDTITARVLQKGNRDLDAVYAAEIARDFSLKHRIVEPPDLIRFSIDDARRSASTDAETTMHSWAVRLFDALPDEPCVVFDGILGDILGNPGFRLPQLYKSPAEDIEVIVETCLPDRAHRLLEPEAWPGDEELRADFRDYLRKWLPRPNLAEFAFILLRQRRMTALWSQQLLPPGHVVVCPFADIEYVRLLLDFVPADKHRANFQRACLEAFWPRFARYPGNRDIPAGVPEGSPRFGRQQDLACRRRLRRAVSDAGLSAEIARLLTRRGRFAWYAGDASDAIALRSAWCTTPLMEFILRRATTCLSIGASS